MSRNPGRQEFVSLGWAVRRPNEDVADIELLVTAQPYLEDREPEVDEKPVDELLADSQLARETLIAIRGLKDKARRILLAWLVDDSPINGLRRGYAGVNITHEGARQSILSSLNKIRLHLDRIDPSLGLLKVEQTTTRRQPIRH